MRVEELRSQGKKDSALQECFLSQNMSAVNGLSDDERFAQSVRSAFWLGVCERQACADRLYTELTAV